MKENPACESGSGKVVAISLLGVAAVALAFLFFYGSVRRHVREFFMQRVTSAHYDILFPTGRLSPEATTQFAAQRESKFREIARNLGGAGPNAKIRVILEPSFPEPHGNGSEEQSYSVSGTTIRTKLTPENISLPSAADAEAILYAAWGKPGNARIARWTAIRLTGEWRVAEIGMAAAELEQKLGHQKLATVLSGPPSELPSLDDQDLLGAAWISEIGEFGGADAVRKLYKAKMSRPNVEEVTKALGTTPLELERKWQMWMYAYLAGMPSMPRASGMPMDMPMAGGH